MANSYSKQQSPVNRAQTAQSGNSEATFPGHGIKALTTDLITLSNANVSSIVSRTTLITNNGLKVTAFSSIDPGAPITEEVIQKAVNQSEEKAKQQILSLRSHKDEPQNNPPVVDHHSTTKQASDRQISLIFRKADERGLNPDEFCQSFINKSLDQLTSSDAHDVIQELLQR